MRRSIDGASVDPDTGLDLLLFVELGEADLVRKLASTAVAFDDVVARELYECCRLIDGGVMVACVSGERFSVGDAAMALGRLRAVNTAEAE